MSIKDYIRHLFSLKERQILGINARNIDYIFANNPRRYYPQVDDKLKTKLVAERAGIHFPQTYSVVEYQQQIKGVMNSLANRKEFVIKPVHGSGGAGVLVIKGRKDNRFIKASGDMLTLGDIRYHISNILSGLYSLGGVYDKALIEYRVKPDEYFKAISYKGVPDIRLIMYKQQPVMSMLRLPTRASDGRANLHAGGIGVGIDVYTGKGVCGVQYDTPITMHPDTHLPLKDIVIDQWPTVIELAKKLSKEVQLGYIGIDIVIDRKYGPMLLEINARPGLAIQIANGEGLLGRLRAIDY